MFVSIFNFVGEQLVTHAGINPSQVQFATTLAWCIKNVVPAIFTADGQPKYQINPLDYFPMGPFLKLAESGYGAEIYDRIGHVEIMSLKGLVWTIQKLYFYKVGKLTLKDHRKLTDEEIRAQALKAKKIAEKAIEDYISCQDKLLNEANDELYPFLAKFLGSKTTDSKINLTDEVFKIETGFQMLEHLTKISPKNETENIKKILTCLLKYSQIWEQLSDMELMYKAHKLAARDLEKLMKNPWKLDSEWVEEAKHYAFDDMEAAILECEKENGVILI